MGIMKRITVARMLGDRSFDKYDINRQPPRPTGGERDLPLFDDQPGATEIPTVGTDTAAAGNQPATGNANTPLWPNTPSGAPLAIEVFGATGAYQSGKTILGLSIAPGAHPAGHPFAGRPRTLYLDFEKSGATYGGAGCRRIDVHAEMTKIHKGKYGADEVYSWFTNVIIGQLPPGQFDVVIADPITDVESGLCNYVRKHPEQFGYTAAQFARAGGLFWGAVKDCWKMVLLQLTSKVQTFFFTSHLRQVWDGDRPVRGKQEPKGKETLMELASLYIWLDRSPDEKGIVPDVPSATVVKQRLADTILTADKGLQIVPLLPPRIPKATIEAIRKYISSPPDYKKLKTGERVIEKPWTDEEKAQVALATAEANRAAEEAHLAAVTRQAELRAMASEALPTNVDQVGKIQAEKSQRALTQPVDDDIVEHAEPDDTPTQEEVDAAVTEATAKAAEMTAKGEALAAGNVDAEKSAADWKPPTEAELIDRGPSVSTTKCTPAQIDAVKAKFIESKGDPQLFGKRLQAKFHTGKVGELSPGECTSLVGLIDRDIKIAGFCTELAITMDVIRDKLLSRVNVTDVWNLWDDHYAKLCETLQTECDKRKK